MASANGTSWSLRLVPDLATPQWWWASWRVQTLCAKLLSVLSVTEQKPQTCIVLQSEIEYLDICYRGPRAGVVCSHHCSSATHLRACSYLQNPSKNRPGFPDSLIITLRRAGGLDVGHGALAHQGLYGNLDLAYAPFHRSEFRRVLPGCLPDLLAFSRHLLLE